MASKSLVAIVTGASSGIGAATAKLLAKQHYSVSLAGRNAQRLDAVAQLCAGAAGGGKVLTTAGDAGDESHLRSLVDRTVAEFGRLDLLVNAAGVMMESMDPSATGGMDVFDATIDVNVRSIVKLTDFCEEHLVKSKGNVVNIGGSTGTVGAMFYSMSKAAVDMYTKCLALKLAPKGVRVNAVCPGAIDTPMVRPQGMPAAEQVVGMIASAHPIGRIGTADEVASLIAVLADSGTAGFITGSLLHIDGGVAVNNALNAIMQMRSQH